jgi:hypothetical protein
LGQLRQFDADFFQVQAAVTLRFLLALVFNMTNLCGGWEAALLNDENEVAALPNLSLSSEKMNLDTPYPGSNWHLSNRYHKSAS